MLTLADFWIIWGLVHILAGIFNVYFVVSGDISDAISSVTDAAEPSVLKIA